LLQSARMTEFPVFSNRKPIYWEDTKTTREKLLFLENYSCLTIIRLQSQKEYYLSAKQNLIIVWVIWSAVASMNAVTKVPSVQLNITCN